MGHATNILAEVQTNLIALRSDFVVDSFTFGARTIAERLTTPRIVWVPTADRFGGARSNGQQVPRSTRTRTAGFVAHIFADTYDVAESIVNDLSYSLHATAHGSYALETAEWPNPEWLTHGFLVLLSFTLDVPIAAPVPVTATITRVGFDTSGAVHGDGIMDAGDNS